MFSNAPLCQFKAGDHICVFYKDDAYLLELLVPYIAQGLHHGERCFCVQKPLITEQLKTSLTFVGINVVEEIGRGSLQLFTEREVYFPKGSFNHNAMMGLLQEAIVDAKLRGFVGLRTAGELSWAVREHYDCNQLLEYEAMVNETFPKHPAIGMCQYDMRCFQRDILNQVFDQHSAAFTEEDAKRHTFTMRHGNYLADVIADRVTPRSNFYYVAQPCGSKEVLGWGTEATFDFAVKKAQLLLGFLSSSRQAPTISDAPK